MHANGSGSREKSWGRCGLNLRKSVIPRITLIVLCLRMGKIAFSNGAVRGVHSLVDCFPGGRAGKKLDEMRAKYQRTCRKLHQTHNEYVLLLTEAVEFEKDYRTTLFPGNYRWLSYYINFCVMTIRGPFQDWSRATRASRRASCRTGRIRWRMPPNFLVSARSSLGI